MPLFILVMLGFVFVLTQLVMELINKQIIKSGLGTRISFLKSNSKMPKYGFFIRIIVWITILIFGLYAHYNHSVKFDTVSYIPIIAAIALVYSFLKNDFLASDGIIDRIRYSDKGFGFPLSKIYYKYPVVLWEDLVEIKMKDDEKIQSKLLIIVTKQRTYSISVEKLLAEKLIDLSENYKVNSITTIED